MSKYLRIDYDVESDDSARYVSIALTKQEDYFVARFSEELLNDLVTIAEKAGMKISLKDI